jgi:ParB family chromosome partitioning protein
MDISIAKITVGKRKREALEAKVLAMMESIREIGLLQPITITKDHTLVFGLHRLEACKRLEWETIPATARTFEGLDAELAEIDENLVRADLTVLERSELLARRHAIYEVRHPETKRGVG